MDVPVLIGLPSPLDRPELSGVIVSHGTDTLEETACRLDLTVKLNKPVILICARCNASSSDYGAPRNLLDAARIPVDAQSKDKDLMLAMNNQINAARYVTRTQTGGVEVFTTSDFSLLDDS